MNDIPVQQLGLDLGKVALNVGNSVLVLIHHDSATTYTQTLRAATASSMSLYPLAYLVPYFVCERTITAKHGEWITLDKGVLCRNGRHSRVVHEYKIVGVPR